MANSLEINVVNIPDEGLKYVLSEDGSRFKECLIDTADADFTLNKVDVDCLITKTSTTVFIKGKLSALITSCCSRCLENVSVAIGGDFTYTLVPAKAETREDLELTAEELEISHYQGDFIDLTAIICEQIILQIPIKTLCKEECKGLCPRCGINLNTSSCNCHLAVVDNRMAVLKNFKVKN
jgi:Predicted metal-binding, possibly nucleic acid-binding protein